MIAEVTTVFEAAGEVRTADSWRGVWTYLPDATWTHATEGGTLAARSWKSLLNDSHMQAIGFCLLSQIHGDGLWFRSRYGARAPKSSEIQTIRRAINDDVADSRTGTALDAGSFLTAADLDAQILLGGFFGGNGWAIKTWKPGRPGTDRATCWRSIDGSRVETPMRLANDPTVANGIRYRNKSPFSIFVRRFDPAMAIARQTAVPEYDEIPLYDADGFRNVVHFAPMRWRADGDLGVPALASGLVFVHQLRELLKAHVTGKRIQASHPIAVEVQDPAKAAAAYQKMVEDGQVDEDAQVLFLPKGSGATFTNAQYQGADLAAVSNVYLRGLTASIGYPWQFVLCQLTESNMAAAQAALDQAERSSSIHQRQWLEQVGRHMDHATIRESWARGTYGPMPWSSDLLAGEWQRPRRADANRQRSRQAAELAMGLGYSLSTIHDELGSDFEREQERLAEDRATAAEHGNDFPPDIENRPSAAVVASDPADPAEGQSQPTQQEAP